MAIDGKLVKITAPCAEDVCSLYEINLNAAELLNANITPKDFLDGLVERELYSDATQFLAHALPHREAVWWACICAARALPNDPPDGEAAALEAAKAWVFKPAQENCQTAMTKAEVAGFKSAGSWAAVAAFWSGETLAPAGSPVVPPTPDLVGKAVAGAVMLAAVSGDETDAADNYRTFLEQGLNIAKGLRAE